MKDEGPRDSGKEHRPGLGSTTGGGDFRQRGAKYEECSQRDEYGALGSYGSEVAHVDREP